MIFDEIEEGVKFHLVIRGGSLDALDRHGMTRNYLDDVTYVKIPPHRNHLGFNINAKAVHQRYGDGYIEGWREVKYAHTHPTRSEIPAH